MTAPFIVAGHTTKVDTANTTSHTINAPTHAQGDVIYIAMVSDGNSDTFTTPDGFTALFADYAIQTAGNSKIANFAVFYKPAGASEPVSYTVTSTVSERCVMVAFAVRNDGGVHASASTRGDSNMATVPAVTTSVAD